MAGKTLFEACISVRPERCLGFRSLMSSAQKLLVLPKAQLADMRSLIDSE